MTSESNCPQGPVDEYSEKIRMAGAIMVLLAAEIRRDLEDYCAHNPLPSVIRVGQPGTVDLHFHHSLLSEALTMEAKGMRMAGVRAQGSMNAPTVRHVAYVSLMKRLADMDPVDDVMST